MRGIIPPLRMEINFRRSAFPLLIPNFPFWICSLNWGHISETHSIIQRNVKSSFKTGFAGFAHWTEATFGDRLHYSKEPQIEFLNLVLLDLLTEPRPHLVTNSIIQRNVTSSFQTGFAGFAPWTEATVRDRLHYLKERKFKFLNWFCCMDFLTELRPHSETELHFSKERKIEFLNWFAHSTEATFGDRLHYSQERKIEF